MNREPFNDAIRYRWFENYIERFLTRKPEGQVVLTLLMDMAERAFLTGVGAEEGHEVRTYLKIYEKHTLILLYLND